MLSQETILRAQTIVKRGQVKVCDDTRPKNFLHFSVQQRTGEWCDVYRTIDAYGRMRWSCSAIRDEKTNHKDTQPKTGRGCVFPTTIRETPFCSHTKSADLFMKNRGLEW